MAINVSVQYNGGLLPDIILLEPVYMPWRGFVFAAFDPTQTFWHFFPLTGGCSEGLGASDFSLKYGPAVIELVQLV